MTTRRTKPAHAEPAVEKPAVEAAPPVEKPTEKPVEAAPDGVTDRPAPDAPLAAPLDPPAPAPDEESAPDGLGITSVATGVMLAEHTAENVPLSLIIDANTQEPPAVDGLFESVTPSGSARRCTARLVQRVYSYGRFDDYLLLPPGAVLSGDEADRFLAIVADQGTTGLPLT